MDMNRVSRWILGSLILLGLDGATITYAQQSEMTFFITSAGSEKGELVNGRGDTPNMPDILTGSQADGTAFAAGDDRTCGNWTKSGQGAAMVGHHDRQGLRDDDASKSWNSSHPTRGPDGGCSQNDLKSTGGNGLFYCLATK